MLTFALTGGVIVYTATCTLAVAVTTPGATMVTEPVADFVGSTMLAAATVAIAFCATGGAV